ncbi:MAG: RHS repeat-associated core domain-containing protein [Flammeovirgaceae bacterium]
MVQYSEYYPFQSTTQNSWTRVNAVKNNFLGNGGTEYNTNSNFYDLEYRHYDPVLGRMNGVDPMADRYSSLSPYNYSFNQPNMVVDVNGADPWWQRYTDMHGGMIDGFHNAVVDGAGGGGNGEPYRNNGYQFAYGRNDAFGNRRTFYDDAFDVMRGRMSMDDYAAQHGIDPKRTDYYTNGDQTRYIDSRAEFYADGKLLFGFDFFDERQVYNPWAWLKEIGDRDRIPDWVPVFGAIESASQAVDRGDGWAAAGNFALAVSDVFLVKSIAKGIAQGGLSLMTKNYKWWSSTRAYLGRTGYAEAGQQVHHWALFRNGAKSGEGFAWWAKSQMWNLMPMKSQVFHQSIHGIGPQPFNLAERAWYGTPTWFKASLFSIGGRTLN